MHLVDDTNEMHNMLLGWLLLYLSRCVSGGVGADHDAENFRNRF